MINYFNLGINCVKVENSIFNCQAQLEIKYGFIISLFKPDFIIKLPDVVFYFLHPEYLNSGMYARSIIKIIVI